MRVWVLTLGIHARLKAVSHGDERPIGHHAVDPLRAALVLLDNKILAASRIKQLDILHRQQLTHKRTRKQRRVLNHHIASLIIKWHTQLHQQVVSRLSNHHTAHQLAAQPRTSTRSHAGLEDGDAQIGSLFGESVGTGEASRAGADDDDVGDSGIHHVGHVARSHGAGGVRLFDLGKTVVAGEVLDGFLAGFDGYILLVLGRDGSGVEGTLSGLEGAQLGAGGGGGEGGGGRRHFEIKMEVLLVMGWDEEGCRVRSKGERGGYIRSTWERG